MTNETVDVPSESKKFLSENLYNRLKFFSLIVLPALTTLYFTLGTMWEWGNVQQIMGTMVALNTFLGVILGISTKRYNDSDAKYDGNIVITESESGGKLYSLEVNGDPSEIDLKKTVIFKVGS
jgi:Putative phage holin Dp-1